MSKVISLVFMGCENLQLTYNPGADDPRPVLEQGKTYTLKDEHIHNWHTLVELNEVPGLFPSVCFQDPRYPHQPFSNNSPHPTSEKITVPSRFNYTPFATDVPSLVQNEAWLVLDQQSPYHLRWYNAGQEVLSMIHTDTTDHQQKLPPVVDVASTAKFIDRHLTGDVNRLVATIRDKMVVDGWVCITMHQRPDGHLKFEWLLRSQHLLTLNVMIH